MRDPPIPETAKVASDGLHPFIKGVLEHRIFDGRDYLVEGVNLRPQLVARFIEEAESPVRACFLGYPHANIEIKAAQVAEFAGLPNDWLHRTGPIMCADILRSVDP